MRRFLISLMAASMLMPAAASAQDRDFRRGDRERSERSERSNDGDRPQRAERHGRSERADRPARAEPAERAGRPARIERADRPARIERQVERRERIHQVEQAPTRRFERSGNGVVDSARAIAGRQQDRDSTETRRRDRDGSSAGWGERVVENGDRRDRERSDRWRERVVDNGSRVDRDGDGRRDWRRDRDGDRRWSRDWRRDSRYDWHSYRNRYRSLFRLGRYYDPYGYRYRRFSIGFSLWPNYYRSNYWLDDPWRYRLPPAYGPYRWVRYHGDALLVNIYTGQVVDVIYNVFW